MIYTDKDKKKFQNSRECHICDKQLPNDSTKTDHLEKIGPWLKTMGLRRCMPTLHEVKRKKNHFDYIKDKDFEEAKRELLAYLKNNKMTVVRDHCHFT